MTDETGLSDAELGDIFDELVDEERRAADTQDPPSAGDNHDDDEKPEDDEAKPSDVTEPNSITIILAAITEADPKDLRQLDRQVSAVLDTVAASDDETQMLVSTLCSQQDLPSEAVVRVLSGLAYRRSQLKRDDKRVDYRNLNAQVRSFLQGKLAWNDITPQEYVEPKRDVDADLVAAGELAAFLKCAVVDVLALADAAKGSNAKTMVSRKKVAEALQGISNPNDKPFDYEEHEDELDNGIKPSAKADPTDDSLQVDDPAPVTGYEYITVDPDDPLSDLDDDWFVKGCRSLVELLDS